MFDCFKKTNKIEVMRKNLKDKKWVERKLDKLADEDEEWNHFYSFECSDFFKGSLKAERNRKKYYEATAKIERRVAFLKSL